MPESTPLNTIAQSPAEAARILVVEDNAPDVLLIGESLRQQGIAFELIHFSDGEDVFSGLTAAVDGGPFDLVILDLKMPRIGGLQVLERLRADAAFVKVPVVVLTSSLLLEEQEQADRLGATRYLKKPLDLYEFLDKVGTAARELIGPQRHLQNDQI
jgi:two-component system, response regulator